MRYYIVASLFLLGLLWGCSSNIAKPTEPLNPINQFTGNLAVGVSDRFPDGTPSGGFGVMGLFTLDIRADELRAELNPIRSSSLPDTLEVVDITNFLMLVPCTNCVKIKSVALDPDGNLIVAIGIKHPFPVGNPLKPITGRNRADLHVFNVEGILAAQGTSTTQFPSLGRSTSPVKLLNASGYTPYLDEVLDDEVFQTDADLHPYILHFADYSQGNFDPINPMGFESVTDPPPSGNLVMAMGCDYDYRDYIFDLDEDITYTYAVGCAYAVSSAAKKQRFNPEYRIPQHLKKAASEVHVIGPTEKLKEMMPDETVMFQVHVVDRSHGVEVGENLDQMLADSSVGQVMVEIPGVLMNMITQPGSASISGTGHDPSDPLVYEFTISNEQVATVGVYQGLVKVIDTYPPGMNTSPLLNGMDGIKRVDPLSSPLSGLFDIDEFATYATFSVEVELGHVGSDPVANITRSIPGCAPANVTLDASGSTDADDPLSELFFEFDYDYDGVIFTVDRAMSHDPIAIANYSIGGCYTAAVRVTDTDSNKNIATVIVPVGHFNPTGTESNITDGVTITDVNFSHGLSWSGDPYNDSWTHDPLATKGLARGNGYLYAAFYGVQSGTSSIFFARSADDGLTWSTPIAVHDYDASANYSGCSIDADNSGCVLIAWTDHIHRDLVLEHSTNNGDTFSTNIISDLPDAGFWSYDHYFCPDIALDPTNSNSITLAVQAWYLGDSYHVSDIYMYVYNSQTGASGSFDQVLYLTPLTYILTHNNIYISRLNYAVDGDAFLILGENSNTYVYKSTDHGITWPDDSNHRAYQGLWGYEREMDVAMDPNNADVFYVVRLNRSRFGQNYPVYLAKSTDGLNLTTIQARVNDNTSGVYKLNPSITVNDAGVVYVTWQMYSSGDYEILADYSCDGGATFHTDVVLNTIDAGDEIFPDIAPNTCGDGFTCAWEQNGLNPNGKLVARGG